MTENSTAVTGRVDTHGIPLTMRSGPGTGYLAVGSLPEGATVTIVCQAHGTTESGDYGPTDVWDRLSDGSYVTDAWIDTGTDKMVAPLCPGAPAPPGGGIQHLLDRFVNDWNGKGLNYDDTVTDYECFSVAQCWAGKYLGLSDFHCQYAAEIIDNYNGNDWARVNKDGGNHPLPGDVVVFHGGTGPGGETITSAGHVDVCLEADGNGFTGLDQNWDGQHYCHKVQHDYALVPAWLTPKRTPH